MIRMSVNKPKVISTASEATVLTKAVLRAAEHLGMTNKSLATVVGVRRRPFPGCGAATTPCSEGKNPSSLQSCSCAFIDHSTQSLAVTKRSPGRGSKIRTQRSIANHSL